VKRPVGPRRGRQLGNPAPVGWACPGRPQQYRPGRHDHVPSLLRPPPVHGWAPRRPTRRATRRVTA